MIVPGFGKGPEDYADLVESLADRGATACVVAGINPGRWYRIALGRVDPLLRAAGVVRVGCA